MNFSQEQKEILLCISNLTKRESQQPRAIFLNEIISSIIPKEFIVCYDLNVSQNSIWLKSHNSTVKDDKVCDKNLGTVILTLFLLEDLLENNLIICYQNNEATKSKSELSDNIAEYNKIVGVEYQSKHYKSPDFARLLNMFCNHKILPNLSLIELTKSKFQTETEIANKKSLRNSLIAICISVIALFLSTTAETYSVIQNRKGLDLSSEGLSIDKQSLKYSKQSATDSSLNIILKELRELSSSREKGDEQIIEALKKHIPKIIGTQKSSTQNVKIIDIAPDLKNELMNNNNR